MVFIQFSIFTQTSALGHLSGTLFSKLDAEHEIYLIGSEDIVLIIQ
jgi:hypothetical protein